MYCIRKKNSRWVRSVFVSMEFWFSLGKVFKIGHTSIGRSRLYNYRNVVDGRSSQSCKRSDNFIEKSLLIKHL